MIALLTLLAAAAALVATVVLAVTARRRQRRSREELTEGMREIGARLDALARELATAVAQVRADGRRERLLGSFDGVLDLDEVLARCVEAAVTLPRVAAAAITVEIDGQTLVATSGVDAGAITPAPGPPGTAPVRAVGLSYHYADGPVDADAMRSAIAVPVAVDGARHGFLTVFGRTEDPPVAGFEFRTIEAVADRAGGAIDAARGRAARAITATDALTGLPGRETLHETLSLEVSRSRRAGEPLALCVFDVDDLGPTNRRLGARVTDALLVEVAERLKDTLRPRDSAFRSGGDEFALLLPASSRINAEATFARVQASLQRLPQPFGAGVSLSAGIAELKPDDDGVSLYERAERALRRAKDAGKGTAA